MGRGGRFCPACSAIGGGFLMTPLLIFVGIAPAVAVASVASPSLRLRFRRHILLAPPRHDPALALVL